MSKFKNKIGWQKYEDLIEKQISSPLLSNILSNVLQNRALESEDEEDEDVDDIDAELLDGNLINTQMPLVFPMSQKLLDDINIISNFDCWVGHTNFDITPRIKDKLDKISGVEVLKIWSRYRFFVGIGNMFDFSEVRKTIEKELINDKEKNN
jgi:hypothetical protein